MKRSLTWCMVLAAAWPCLAGTLEREILTVNNTTSTTYKAYGYAATNKTIRGWIEDVQIDIIGAATGSVYLMADCELSTVADANIVALTSLSADKLVRPRFDATDTLGAAFKTNDPSLRWPLIGDALKLYVTNFNWSNITVKAIIKYERSEGRR